MPTKTTLAAALVASSLTPAFAQEAANDDYRAVLTVGYYEGGFRTTIIDGYQNLESCILQAKIAGSAQSARSAVSCEKDGRIVGAMACKTVGGGPIECKRIDLTLP